jgi:hypothetical protein
MYRVFVSVDTGGAFVTGATVRGASEREIERERGVGVFLPLWFSAHRSGALFLPAALSYKEILHRA